MFYGQNYSSSEDEGKEDLIKYKAKSIEKLDLFKTNVQTVMSNYNINRNKITYNLTESERDLKLRQMQRSQSSFNIRKRIQNH